MSLESAADARRVASLSRATYDRTRALLDQLPPDGLTAQSACADWKVYQVVSHIGSQPAIHQAVLEAGLRGAAPMTDEQRRAIWDHFDSLGPTEVLPEFKRTNEAYHTLVDSLSDQELGQAVPWIFGQTPVAMVIASRLNEQVLHEWDIRWAQDRGATLNSDAVPALLEVNLTPARVSGLAKPDRAGQLQGQTVRFRLSDSGSTGSGASYDLRLQPDAVSLAPSAGDSPALTVDLPAEAFIRLIWGRLPLDQALASGVVRLDRPELAGALNAALPGR
jgi:uncharacterized protein (TIGR03083 family)